MAENSKIEWTNHTFNPWVGCQNVSPGCDNCYAETLMDKRLGRVEWGPHGERKRTAAANWNKPLQWDRAALVADVRHKVFCASLADWLDNKVILGWRDDLADLIRKTPNLDWLLLTKRIENFNKLTPWTNPPRHVWIGATTEDQKHFDRRWKHLGAIKASVRFISYEPALGPLILGDARPDWVICGGESGANARMMDLQWARALRDECAEKGVAFFFKQVTGKGAIPPDLMVRQFPTLRRGAQ
jgi:protein gp37